jgi:hypothetical protein
MLINPLDLPSIYAALRKIKAANKQNKRTATNASQEEHAGVVHRSELLTAGCVSQAVVTSPAVDTSKG